MNDIYKMQQEKKKAKDWTEYGIVKIKNMNEDTE